MNMPKPLLQSHLFFRVLFVALLCTFLPVKSNAQSLPCDVVQILPNPSGPLFYSPDSSMYFVNEIDTAGVYQIYVANAGDTAPVCISATGPWAFFRPWIQRQKLQVQWHPSGDFIICAVEKEFYPELLYVPYNLRLGWLQSGIWMDVWAVTPNGSNWYNLAYTENGVTGPAFTPDGLKCVWSEAKDSSNIFVDVFGVWKLRLEDFVVNNGVPAFANTQDITPPGSRWNEPGNFAPDGVRFTFNADIGMANAEGQDQYIMDITNLNVINLTNSPMIWDEHGVFSPDGHKILFMSSYPYQADTNSYHTLTIKTEFMLMNDNGTGLQQLTHLCDTGYIESPGGIAATGFWKPDGTRIYAQSLTFPFYENWIIDFFGNCGNDTTTAVTELNNTVSLNVFPNPNNGLFTIEAQSLNNAPVDVQVFDARGQLIETFRMNGNKQNVDLSNYSSGLYSIRISDGTSVLIRRVTRL